jgi:hypothetical protein
MQINNFLDADRNKSVYCTTCRNCKNRPANSVVMLTHSSRTLLQELSIKVDDSNSDIVSEHTHHVGRQHQQLRQLAVVDAVLGAAKSIADQVGGGVGVQWFHFEALLALQQQLVHLFEAHLALGQAERAQRHFAAHVLADEPDGLQRGDQVPQAVRGDHQELVFGRQSMMGYLAIAKEKKDNC